jgi:hypothetical protein
MDASAPQRQLQAQLTTVAASTVTSVRLTVTGSAANLSADPAASTTVAITAPLTPKTSPPAKASPTTAAPTKSSPPPLAAPARETITSPLPVGGLPRIPAAGSSLNPGGDAAGLFPTLDPKPSSSSAAKARTRPVANTSALPEGAPIVDGQLAGLAALALAFVLTVTRLSVRRRSRAKSPQDKNTTEATEGTPSKDGER